MIEKLKKGMRCGVFFRARKKRRILANRFVKHLGHLTEQYPILTAHCE